MELLDIHQVKQSGTVRYLGTHQIIEKHSHPYAMYGYLNLGTTRNSIKTKYFLELSRRSVFCLNCDPNPSHSKSQFIGI